MTELTSLKDARDAIENQWIAEWGDTTPFTFDNEKALPPAAVAAAAQSNDISSWCRLVVRQTTSVQETIGAAGNRKFQRQGNIIVQVFTPVDRGTTDSDTLAMAARTVFEGAKFNGVKCYAGIVSEKGTDGAWWQINVTIPFVYYETL